MTDNTEFDFKTAYEKEKLKSADLAQRIADLEDKNQELEFKLNRIKNNPIWKASTPARNVMHFVKMNYVKFVQMILEIKMFYVLLKILRT